MCSRIIDYYHYCIDPKFARHMIDELGLSDRDKSIVRLLRQKRCNAQMYAELMNMPVKAFNEATGHIHRRMMDELFRLALIGWRAENSQK